MCTSTRLILCAFLISTFQLAGCSGGPSGEIGSVEWCKSLKEMSQDEIGEYAGGLKPEEGVKVSECMMGLIK
jgi:hypothetical protein